MKAIIKESHSSEELISGCLCVTPQNFGCVKSWVGVTVEGLDYYCNKAVSMGAIKPDAKTTRKRRSDK